MQTELVIQNPHASKPMHIPLTVECNVREETILANVLANSRQIKNWVREMPAHDRIAIICGGGPSLADSLAEIASLPGDIFALNGAATFLHCNGIWPDYQVLMDARPESADLIGPAKQHLFASQVDPRCFDLIPHATLWHATHGTLEVDRQEGFPEHHQDYCLIGGAVSVGNTTLALLNVLGYRTIHVFGMDCSHRDGKSHAYAQPLNDGDPVTLVEFNSQLYTCSVSMSLQCKHFLERARALETQGCAIHVHGYGLLPDVWNAPVGLLSEREKYEHMWTFPRYRESSPGEALVSDFVAEMQPISDASIIDFGCGPGRATQKLHDMGYDAIGVDIAANCLDADVTIPLVVSPFWELPPALHADYGFCCDVMEHIEPHRVDDVLAAISQCVHRGCYLQIAFTPDNFGPALIGEPLHLTVESADWWASKLREYFVYVNVKPSGDGWRGIFICKEPIRRSH